MHRPHLDGQTLPARMAAAQSAGAFVRHRLATLHTLPPSQAVRLFQLLNRLLVDDDAEVREACAAPFRASPPQARAEMASAFAALFPDPAYREAFADALIAALCTAKPVSELIAYAQAQQKLLFEADLANMYEEELGNRLFHLHLLQLCLKSQPSSERLMRELRALVEHNLSACEPPSHGALDQWTHVPAVFVELTTLHGLCHLYLSECDSPAPQVLVTFLDSLARDARFSHVRECHLHLYSYHRFITPAPSSVGQ
jgi:hypothetical protein